VPLCPAARMPGWSSKPAARGSIPRWGAERPWW